MPASTKLNGVLATLGATFTLGGFAAFIKHTIDAHDATYKLSQKLGIAVGELSQYNYALGLSDVSHESFEKGVKALSQRLVESTDATSKASKLFTLMGVNVRAGVTVRPSSRSRIRSPACPTARQRRRWRSKSSARTGWT
jgi:hypothetical protein